MQNDNFFDWLGLWYLGLTHLLIGPSWQYTDTPLLCWTRTRAVHTRIQEQESFENTEMKLKSCVGNNLRA